MPKIKYADWPNRAGQPNPEHQSIVDRANAIITEYQNQGFDLTLRQLYYQFVARGVIPNRDQEYKRLGSIISDARRAGLIDWNAIVDRTRFLRETSHWSSPQAIIEGCAAQFAFDKWADQKFRPEVWIEKDALIGVVESAAEPLDVPFFSCRGYTSDSEVWAAAQRMRRHARGLQRPFIIHLGDHDPSGVDMSRDIRDRISLFGGNIQFERVALNMDQVRQFDPPPNPAKITDSRCQAYIADYGEESWELDALDPVTLSEVITRAIKAVRDDDKWDAAVEREQAAREQIGKVADRWEDVREYLGDD